MSPGVSPAAVNKLGGQVQNLARTALDIQDKEWERANRLRVRKAENEVSQYRSLIMDSRERGALNTRGEDAFAAPKTVFTDYDQKIEELMDGLANDDQKGLFAASANATRMTIDDQLQKHVAREGRAYDDNITTAYRKNRRADAESNALSDRRVQFEIDQAARAIEEQSDRLGDAKNVIAWKKRLEESDTRKAVIERLVDQDRPEEALAHLMKYEDRLVGNIRDGLRDLIDDATEKGNGLIAADNAWKEAKGNFTKAMDIISKTKDEGVRRRGEASLRRKRADQKERIAEGKRFRYKKGLSQMKDGDSWKDPQYSIEPSLWAKFSTSEKKALMKESQDPVTNSALFNRFNDLTMEEIRKINPIDLRMSYRANFSAKDRIHFDNVEKIARYGPESAKVSRESVNSAIKSGARFLKIDDKPVQQDAFARKFREKVHEFEVIDLDGKRKVNQDQLNKISDDMVTEGVFHDADWLDWDLPDDSRIKATEISKKSLQHITIKKGKILAKEKQDIIDSFKTKKLGTPNEEDIRKIAALYRVARRTEDKAIRIEAKRLIKKIMGIK